MATTATATKPVAAKAPLAKPAARKVTLAKPAKGAAKKPAAIKTAKPPKEVKPFEDGELVIFKGYTTPPKGTPFFTEGEELAVVGQAEKDGHVMVSCVKSSQYHSYKSDPDSVDGEQLLVPEVKRTNKRAPEPFHLPVVGDMATILKTEHGDPLAVAQKLYSDASRAFFYFGGTLAKLYKEVDEDTGLPIFCGYQDDKGKSFENSKEGFEAFLNFNFGDVFGGYRKAQYYMAIYENFSSLENAADVIKELPKVGWWKAGMLAQYVTDQNATELVQIAQQQSAAALNETLKTQYTTEGSTAKGTPASRHAVKRSTFNFKLYEDSGVAIDMILKAAGKQLGLQDPSAVFEHIFHQWASEHLGDVAGKAKAATDRARSALKKQGVKLPADHPLAKEQPKAA